MNDEVIHADMRKSMKDFKLIEPLLQRLLNGGQSMMVEGDDNAVCRMLDMTCGTDYFHIYDDRKLCWGVASRIQHGTNYRSFTIRKSRENNARTEFEKRKFAIAHGGVYPYLTLQAYIDKDMVMGLGLAKTTDIIAFIESGNAEENHTGERQIGQAGFYVCKWDRMRDNGFKVYEYRATR